MWDASLSELAAGAPGIGCKCSGTPVHDCFLWMYGELQSPEGRIIASSHGSDAGVRGDLDLGRQSAGLMSQLLMGPGGCKGRGQDQ